MVSATVMILLAFATVIILLHFKPGVNYQPAFLDPVCQHNQSHLCEVTLVVKDYGASKGSNIGMGQGVLNDTLICGLAIGDGHYGWQEKWSPEPECSFAPGDFVRMIRASGILQVFKSTDKGSTWLMMLEKSGIPDGWRFGASSNALQNDGKFGLEIVKHPLMHQWSSALRDRRSTELSEGGRVLNFEPGVYWQSAFMEPVCDHSRSHLCEVTLLIRNYGKSRGSSIGMGSGMVNDTLIRGLSIDDGRYHWQGKWVPKPECSFAPGDLVRMIWVAGKLRAFKSTDKGSTWSTMLEKSGIPDGWRFGASSNTLQNMGEFGLEIIHTPQAKAQRAEMIAEVIV